MTIDGAPTAGSNTVQLAIASHHIQWTEARTLPLQQDIESRQMKQLQWRQVTTVLLPGFKFMPETTYAYVQMCMCNLLS